jgi:hypothetical protein
VQPHAASPELPLWEIMENNVRSGPNPTSFSSRSPVDDCWHLCFFVVQIKYRGMGLSFPATTMDFRFAGFLVIAFFFFFFFFFFFCFGFRFTKKPPICFWPRYRTSLRYYQKFMMWYRVIVRCSFQQ